MVAAPPETWPTREPPSRTPALRFAASSLACAALDAGVLAAVYALSGQLVASVVAARLISAAVNFVVNRRLVFHHTGDVRPAALRYAALVVSVLAANTALMTLLVDGFGWPLLAAKTLVEPTLFAAGYLVQRFVVFAWQRCAYPTARFGPPAHAPLTAPARRNPAVGSAQVRQPPAPDHPDTLPPCRYRC